MYFLNSNQGMYACCTLATLAHWTQYLILFSYMWVEEISGLAIKYLSYRPLSLTNEISGNQNRNAKYLSV